MQDPSVIIHTIPAFDVFEVSNPMGSICLVKGKVVICIRGSDTKAKNGTYQSLGIGMPALVMGIDTVYTFAADAPGLSYSMEARFSCLTDQGYAWLLSCQALRILPASHSHSHQAGQKARFSHSSKRPSGGRYSANAQVVSLKSRSKVSASSLGPIQWPALQQLCLA